MQAVKIGVLCLSGLVLSGCAWLFPEDGCRPKTVTVFTEKGGLGTSTRLRVYPEIIRVKRGCTVVIKFPRGSNGSITNPIPSAVVNTVSPTRIELEIPTGTPLGESKYLVKVASFGEIDPRIRVVR